MKHIPAPTARAVELYDILTHHSAELGDLTLQQARTVAGVIARHERHAAFEKQHAALVGHVVVGEDLTDADLDALKRIQHHDGTRCGLS